MSIKKYKDKFFAFTLAEVLIVIGMIGIIANMTIPTLINNAQEQTYKTGYKKAYSVLSQALVSASADGNIIPQTGSYASQGADANFAAIKGKFIVTKSCIATSAELAKCWNTTGEEWRGEGDSAASFIDNSGMAWRLRARDVDGVFPAILIDTNGSKRPNQYGKDRFPFLFSGITTIPVDPSDVWNSYMDLFAGGLPTKFIPMGDVTLSGDNNLSICPSLATHPCYYTSWITGGN